MSDKTQGYRIEGFCPICGVRLELRHHCNPRVLRGIDSANTKALREEDIESSYKVRLPSLDERIRLGYKLLAKSDDSYSCKV